LQRVVIFGNSGSGKSILAKELADRFQSLAAQNTNMDMLIDWVKQYPVRTDEFSGKKTEYGSNDRDI